MKLLILMAAFLVVPGCATATDFSAGAEQARYDAHTKYSVQDAEGGFAVAVTYSRYQHIPETDAVIAAAKSNAMTIAFDVADQRMRPIKPINEQRIQISTGRNAVSGLTTCTIRLRAEYAAP